MRLVLGIATTKEKCEPAS